MKVLKDGNYYKVGSCIFKKEGKRFFCVTCSPNYPIKGKPVKKAPKELLERHRQIIQFFKKLEKRENSVRKYFEHD